MTSEAEKAQEDTVREIQHMQQEFMRELTPEEEQAIIERKKKEDAMPKDEFCLLSILRMAGMPNPESVVQATPKSGYISLATGILTKCISNIEICTSCLLFIGDTLQGKPQGASAFVDERDISALFLALTQHGKSLPVCKQVLAILGNVLITKDRSISVRISKELNTIANISKNFPADLDIQRGCCFVLSGVVDVARAELSKAGGAATAIAMMQRFPDDASIQHNCCYVLAGLALDEPSKKAIGTGGGVDCVVAAMKKFAGSNPRILSYAAYALANLVHECSENSARVRSAGGIRPLVDALQRYPGEAQTASNVCYALFKLAEDSEQNAKRMADLGAAAFILPCIRAHAQQHTDVASNGAYALSSIFAVAPAKIPEFVAAGGLDAVAQAMSAGVRSCETQRACLGLLGAVASESEAPDTRAAICKTAAGPIVAGLAAFKTDLEVQMNGLALVSTIIMGSPECQAMLGAKGAVEAVLAAMAANAKVLELQQAALNALTNLVFKSVANQRKVVAAKGVQTICDTMKSFDPAKVAFDLSRKSEFLSLQATACMALINTCENNTEAQLDAGACGCLDTVLALAKSNKAIAKTCYSTVMVLLSTQKAHAKYCSPKFIEAVEGSTKGLSGSKDSQLCVAALKRVQDPRAANATKRGVCTNTAIPLCKNNCPYKHDKGYCVNCIAVQWVRFCATCSRKNNDYLIYCPVCWELHHKGHEGIKLFIPGRCDCEEKDCALPSSAAPAATSQEQQQTPKPAPASTKPQQQKQQQQLNKKKQQSKKKTGKKK